MRSPPCRVDTRLCWTVIASDCCHLYSHLDEGRVFPITYSVGDTLEGYKTLKKLASSRHHVVPGHDPDVLKIYPAVKSGLGELDRAAGCRTERLISPSRQRLRQDPTPRMHPCDVRRSQARSSRRSRARRRAAVRRFRPPRCQPRCARRDLLESDRHRLKLQDRRSRSAHFPPRDRARHGSNSPEALLRSCRHHPKPVRLHGLRAWPSADNRASSSAWPVAQPPSLSHSASSSGPAAR